jgi:biopolymer transport protein ExbB
MVEVFSRLSMVGAAKMGALSSGISQALFTTVAGLSIGIPSLIAYNLFSRRIDSILLSAEEQLNTLVNENEEIMIKRDS